ncbi:MAG: peptidase [Lachnospiraceae bacterium]|nr:peptidase [Lachnospiraceae bacterium]
MKILIFLLIFCINTFIITVITDMFILGTPRKCREEEPKQKCYILAVPNRIDFQRSAECSGFSAAHVLRSFGVEADGNELYARMQGKLRNGAVLPKNLRKALKLRGFKVRYCRGNLNTLKSSLSEGKRVIAFVKTRKDRHWLHYVHVVGYDEEHVLIADSLRELANCKEEHYNRKLSYAEFLELWDTREIYMPFYKNTFLMIEKQEV